MAVRTPDDAVASPGARTCRGRCEVLAATFLGAAPYAIVEAVFTRRQWVPTSEKRWTDDDYGF